MSCIASRRGKFLTSSFSKFQIKEVFTAFISRAPAMITKVSFKRSITFLDVGVSDEISSIIRQYSKGGMDAIIVSQRWITFSRWIFLLISSVVKSFQSIAKTVSFSLKRKSRICANDFLILSVSSNLNIFLSVVIFFSKCDLPEPMEPSTKVLIFRLMFWFRFVNSIFLPIVKYDSVKSIFISCSRGPGISNEYNFLYQVFREVVTAFTRWRSSSVGISA